MFLRIYRESYVVYTGLCPLLPRYQPLENSRSSLHLRLALE